MCITSKIKPQKIYLSGNLLILENFSPQNIPALWYAAALQKQLTSSYDSVWQSFQVQHERQKELYDRRIHGEPYVVGDRVWLLNPKVPIVRIVLRYYIAYGKAPTK